jgi:acyl carrier protein
MDIAEKVKEIIVNQLALNPEEVTDNASFMDDLGADSLDQVTFVMELEKEFGIEVPDEDAKDITTVGEAINYIEEKVKQKEEEAQKAE